MEKEQRSRLQKATQDARRLLEEEFAGQLLQAYDINVAAGRWNEEPGAHLQAEQRLIREKLVAWIEHKGAQIKDRKEALLLALREMAFTALNRFVALKLMEARELVRPCVSGGLESEGFQEFTAVAQGLVADQESSYRLYLETIFEDVSRELRALFDPRDPASLLWPKRTALLELLDILNRPELAELWGEDETLGWVYQYFNGDAERKKMREESSAPRNSRELAVRNQFFTPRYVVEFLTDNTLGRIWYEMRQGDTGLKERCRYLVRRPNEIWLQAGEEAPAEVVADEALSQEELLRQPVPFPHRPLKDPREIRMLDPACGSMHFGLYAFDLYLEIYTEAWEIAQGSDEQAKQGEAFAPFVAYAADFANKAAFLREVPRLILLHNIHGIDIDPRATQIARLTLWLRAQRAWQEQQLEVAARPPITRSNVVCAEPMPGERELLADFVDQQFPDVERGLVQQLLKAIFDKMQLAGEAGSLLKIEEEIRDSINLAQREWRKLAVQQQDLFNPIELAALGEVGSSLNTDLQNLTKYFWVNIEERIYTALHDYAEQVKDVGGFQRRLFAEDAAQGFAFIDICRQRFDAALMNPPFGEPIKTMAATLGLSADIFGRDLFSAFVASSIRLLSDGGLLGAITPRSGFSLSTMEAWRDNTLRSIQACADLGYGVLDAKVETAAYTIAADLQQDSCDRNSHRLFIDAQKYINKELVIQQAVNHCNLGNLHSAIYLRAPRSFDILPFKPYSYSLDPRISCLFEHSHRFQNAERTVASGMTTSDDFRFVRAWWEVPETEILVPDQSFWKQKIAPVEIQEHCVKLTSSFRWVPFAKGGEYFPFYINIALVVNWKDNGGEVKSFAETTSGTSHWSRYIRSSDKYFLPGLTYLARTSVRLCASILPVGSIFSHEAGPGIFINDGTLKRGLARFNSTVLETLSTLSQISSSLNEGDGEIQCIDETGEELEVIKYKYRKKYAVGLLQKVPWPAPHAPVTCDTMVEDLLSKINHLFSRDETSRRFESFSDVPDREIDEIVGVIIDVDREVCQDYQVDPALPWSMTYGSSSISDVKAKISASCDIVLSWRSQSEKAMMLIQYAIGIAFGRWDIRHRGPLTPPLSCESLFDPLPRYAPGQIRQALDDSPSISREGILVCDHGHTCDLYGILKNALDILIRVENKLPYVSCEDELSRAVGARSVKDYLCKPAGFFADHLKRYSKSRRQAPIYWQISAGNDRYSAWLYYQRFTQDTLYRVLRDFIEPRIQQAEREQFELESQGALSGDAATRLQEAQSLLQDLRLFKSELDLVAPLWNPNLNDGVIINHAILWRITPYTPWQKKCKECWDKLVKGDYDWAHLAFHLWPERVIKKCQSDRSLAIAHGLEERLWQETNKGSWLQRQVTEAELQALIAEHSKPAVQNALERFLAAPPPVAAARTRAPRAARSSSTGTTRRPRGSATAVDAEASRQTLLVLTAAPAEGLGRNAIADLLDVEAATLTAVIKQLKESGQIEQLGAARGARYRLTEQGRAAVESQAGEED